VIQHIIEHGDEDHRRIAYSKLLGNAVALTLSQYGQKAIMSALKSRDPFFIDQFVDILCDRDGATRSPSSGGSPTPSSRRSVLVDIASAPQGVQIVTQLLTSVQPAQRELIIKTVRKNSVFLKGSKAGLRVHQLCDRARAFTGY
jgi:pumilio RNA-binding family